MKMKLELEFIPRYRIPWAGLTFLLMTFIYGVTQFVNWTELNAAREKNENSIAKIKSTMKDKQRSAMKSDRSVLSAVDLQRSKSEKVIIQSLNYPWNRILANIEQAQESDVAVLSFAHEQSSEQTQLLVEALDVPASVRFVKKLNDGNDSEWYIANYQTQPQNNPPTIKSTVLSK